MSPSGLQIPIQSAMCLSGAFSCGIVENQLGEVRRTGMHEGVVVSWLLKGSGTFTQDGAQHRLLPGTTCLRRPDRPYTLALDGQMQHVRCFLKLPEDCYPALCRFLPSFDSIPAIHALAYSEARIERIVRFIHRLRDTADADAYRLLPDAMDLLRHLTALQTSTDALAQAAALLSDPSHFRQPLPWIAQAAGLPYNALRKQFPRRFGLSPGQFRQEKRMEIARQALATGDSISAVAERLGFADVYTFSKQFRAATGESPGHYRRGHIV